MHWFSALETFVTMRYINLHLPLPLPFRSIKMIVTIRYFLASKISVHISKV